MSEADDSPTDAWRGRLAPWQLGVAIAAVALPGLALQLALFDRSVVPMDEGHLAAAAQWMLRGQALYRDVHTGIFPGIYYLTAGLFRLASPDLIVMRAAAVVVNLATGLCLLLVARRVVRLHWAALAPVLHVTLVAIAFPVLTMFNYSTLSLAFGLAALLFTLRYLESGRTADGVALGLWIAASALTKQNFGGLVLIACFAALVWERPRSPLRARTWVGMVAPVVGAGGTAALLAVAHFAWIGTLGDLVESTVLALGGSQVVDFNNPIPPIFGRMPVEDPRFLFLYSPPTLFNALLHGETLLGTAIGPGIQSWAIRLSYLVPLTVLASGAVWLLASLRGEPSPTLRRDRVVVLFALVFFPGIFPSAIWSHLCFVIPPIVLVGLLLLDRAESALAPGRPRPARAVAAGTCALALLVYVEIARDVRGWYPHPMGVERASLHGSPEQIERLRATSRFVERCAGDDHTIFVAPDIPIVYFLADRLSPSPYDLMIPGNVDGRLIAERLEATRTRCVVYNPVMYPEFPAFDALFPELARYLETHYHPSARLGSGEGAWRGLERRGGGAP